MLKEAVRLLPSDPFQGKLRALQDVDLASFEGTSVSFLKENRTPYVLLSCSRPHHPHGGFFFLFLHIVRVTANRGRHSLAVANGGGATLVSLSLT